MLESILVIQLPLSVCFLKMIHYQEISEKKSINGFGWKYLIYTEILLTSFENYIQSDLI